MEEDDLDKFKDWLNKIHSLYSNRDIYVIIKLSIEKDEKNKEFRACHLIATSSDLNAFPVIIDLENKDDYIG